MNIVFLLCAWLGLFEGQTNWISKVPLPSQPVPLYPQNTPFFTFYELRSAEKEIFDPRPDVLHTNYNFSVYSSPNQPIGSLLTTIEDRCYASLPSFEKLLDNLPHITFRLEDFSPIPWPHPPLSSHATAKEKPSLFFPNRSLCLLPKGSTGLSSRIDLD